MTPEQVEKKNVGRRILGIPDLNADGTDPWTAEDYATFEGGDMPKPKEIPAEPQQPEQKAQEPEKKQDAAPEQPVEVKQPEMTEEMVKKFLKEHKGIEVDDFEA